MSKRGLFSLNRYCIFRETFNSYEATRKKSNKIVDIDYKNGEGYFNGSSSYIQYPGLQLGKEITFRTIVTLKRDGYSAIFGGGLLDADGYEDGFYIGADTRNGLERLVIVNKGINDFHKFGTPLGSIPSILNKPSELVFSISKEKNAIEFYLNGEYISNRTYSPYFDSLFCELAAIGGRTYYNPSYSHMSVELVEIYNKALTKTEVSNLYSAREHKDIRTGLVLDIDARKGIIKDNIGNNLLIYRPQHIKVVKDKVESIEFSMHSSDRSYIQTPELLIGNEATFNLWFKVLENGESLSNMQSLVEGYSTTTLRFLYHRNNKIINIRFDSSDATYNLYLPNNMELNTWHMLSVTIANNGTFRVFLNGRYDGEGTSILNENVFLFGCERGSFYGFFGRQNQIRIYNRVLSDKEITQLYTSQERNYR